MEKDKGKTAVFPLRSFYYYIQIIEKCKTFLGKLFFCTVVFQCAVAMFPEPAFRMLGGDPDGKIHKLLEFAGRSGDVADPWYSDRFDIAWRDIYDGCAGLLETLLDE